VRDSGSIVVGWLAKLALVLGLLGLLAYDGLVVVIANFHAADRANAAASEAADEIKRTRGDVQRAYDAATRVVDPGDTIETETFTVRRDGVVDLYVDREAKTLWLHHIGPLKKWTHARQSGVGSPGE
jgi:hypothetical protein